MIHGDRSQSQRTAALEGFQRGRIRVLVATDVASRGIHVQDIAHVINYDLPEVAENFIHRVGRTGRAGGSGVASTLFTRDQRTDIFQLERALGIKIERMKADTTQPQIQPQTHTQPTHSPKPGGHANSSRHSNVPKSSLICLPGEFLQAQLEG
jgi:ATP-dependent RNA helicase RhlE